MPSEGAEAMVAAILIAVGIIEHGIPGGASSEGSL
jgi:hypothetical protein